MRYGTITPKTVHEDVLRLCRDLVPDPQPIFLGSVDIEGSEIPLECFENARLRADKSGGQVVYGWTIWEWPRVMIEGEFHAVWRDVNGSLVDVTPRIESQNRILFLPDPSRSYDGLPLDNVRLALADDEAILDLIKAAEEHFKIMNRGARIFHRAVSIPEHEILPVRAAMERAAQRIAQNLRKRGKR